MVFELFVDPKVEPIIMTGHRIWTQDLSLLWSHVHITNIYICVRSHEKSQGHPQDRDDMRNATEGNSF